MPARLLYFLVNLFWAISVAFLCLIVLSIPFDNGVEWQASWSAQTGLYETAYYPELRQDGVEAKVRDGNLSVSSEQVAHNIVAIINMVVRAALWLTLIWQLRQTIKSVLDKRPFRSKNVGRLRLAGWMMLAVPAWEWLYSFVWPPLVLGGVAERIDWFVLPHWMIRAGEETIGISADVDASLIWGGLVVLVISEVFRSGVELRSENEAFV